MKNAISTLILFAIMVYLQSILGGTFQRNETKPFVIGLVSICGGKGDDQRAMGTLISERLKLFSQTMLSRHFQFHQFDVCEDSLQLVYAISTIMLDSSYTDSMNNTLVEHFVTFLPEYLLKIAFSVVSFTPIKMWPLQIVDDMKFFEKSRKFLPIYELLPEDFITNMISRRFTWDNVHIVEVLFRDSQPPVLSIERLWQQVKGKKCISYSQVTSAQVRQLHANVKMLYDALKEDTKAPVVFVVGRMAGMFMNKAHTYGVQKYWVLFANYLGKHSNDTPNLISILNSGSRSATIRIPYKTDSVCSPNFIDFQQKHARQILCRDSKKSDLVNYSYQQYKAALSLVPKRLYNILLNEIKKRNYQRPELIQRVNDKEMKTDSIHNIIDTEDIEKCSKLSRCSMCKECKMKCNNTTIRQVNGGPFKMRFNYACQSCLYPLVLEKNGQCVACPDRFLPNVNQTRCYDPIEVMEISNVFYILTGIGLFITMTTIIVFTKNRLTPVVKSSNFSLSLIQLISCTLLYVAFLILHTKQPDTPVCTARPFVISTLLVSIVAVVVCKAEKLLMVFFKKTRVTKKDIKDIFVRQLFIFGFLLVVNFILIPASFTLPATVERIPYKLEDGIQYFVLHCSSDNKFDIQLIYEVVILMLAMAQGYRGRKLPTHYNEGVSIVIASAATGSALILAIGVLHSNRYPHYKIEIAYVALSAGLILMVGCLYGAKVYIILFQATKNTKIYHMRMMLEDSRKHAEKVILIPRKKSRSGSQVKLELMLSRDSL